MKFEEPNYNEIVVVPLLQKKYTELVGANLVLEANLLVERARVQHLNGIISQLESKLETFSKKRKKDSPDLDGGVI